MKNVVALYEESGNSMRPWAEAGYSCFCFDLVNDGRVEHFPSGGSITYIQAHLPSQEAKDMILALSPVFMACFPPCTDMATSGSRHFEAKRKADPEFETRPLRMALFGHEIAAKLDIPCMTENPVSRLAAYWRKPNFTFHPWEYGGYLPENDIHPRWPDYILPRDAYPKKTCIWSNSKFKMPIKKPVEVLPGYSIQHKKLGGKSEKTKQIRSEGPRGFLRAVFEANKPET